MEDAAAPADRERRAMAPGGEPLPAASTPTSSTPASSTNGMNVPMALEPPPTQAITRRGRRPVRSRICARASSPMIRWRSRTSAGNGAGPTQEPIA